MSAPQLRNWLSVCACAWRLFFSFSSRYAVAFVPRAAPLLTPLDALDMSDDGYDGGGMGDDYGYGEGEGGCVRLARSQCSMH
jgi:hypothetical protein